MSTSKPAAAALAVLFVSFSLTRETRAGEPSPAAAATNEEEKEADDTKAETVPAEAPSRKTDLAPAPAEPPTTNKIRFTADPVGDGGVIVIGVVFGTLSSAILGTNEIRPQQISPDFRASQLLGIDRGAIRQKVDPNANMLSNIGLSVAIGYAVIDTTLDIWREGKSAALVDFVMYVEALLVTQAVTNLAKIAFRRPRPYAYIAREEHIRAGGDPATYNNAAADSSLSFISGHSSQTAAMAAAATYIAFSRSPGSPRAWGTLGAGALVTSFVAYERVRSGAHFPTDVIAGAAVGAGVGALVVHLHREDSVRQRPVWIGITPVHEGAMVGASGLF